MNMATLMSECSRHRLSFRSSKKRELVEALVSFKKSSSGSASPFKKSFKKPVVQEVVDVVQKKTRQRKPVRPIDLPFALQLKRAWQVGSSCSIFSASRKRWVRGKISNITGEGKSEWLVVKYGRKGRKKIQRYSEYIAPLLQIGSLCSILTQSREWHDAIVRDIYHVTGGVDDGEWLKVLCVSEDSLYFDHIQRGCRY